MQYANAAPPAKLNNISSNIMHLYGLDMEHFVHTTNTEEMDMDYYDYPKIHIEEVD